MAWRRRLALWTAVLLGLAPLAAAADDPLLLATDFAEVLVREGVPFREAHEAVGRLVRHCVEKKLDLRSLLRADLAAFHASFPADASEIASTERSLEQRSLPGGTARAPVNAALAHATEAVARARAELGGTS